MYILGKCWAAGPQEAYTGSFVQSWKNLKGLDIPRDSACRLNSIVCGKVTMDREIIKEHRKS